MNPFEMVVLIVAIVMVAGVMRARYSHGAGEVRSSSDPELARTKEELRALRDRIAVLERIATDKEIGLEHEIERLRDR